MLGSTTRSRLVMISALVAILALVALFLPDLRGVGTLGLFAIGMAWDDPTFLPGLKAGADLTAAANQYKFVKLDANGDVILCTARGEFAIGSLYNQPNTGQPAQVAYAGVVLVQADAAINEGDAVTPSADAQASPVVAAGSGESFVKTDDAGVAQDPVVGSIVFGRALKAPAAAAEIFPVLVTREGAIPDTIA